MGFFSNQFVSDDELEPSAGDEVTDVEGKDSRKRKATGVAAHGYGSHESLPVSRARPGARGPGRGHAPSLPPSRTPSRWPPARDRGSESRSDGHAAGPGTARGRLVAVRRIPSRPAAPAVW